jgi:pimeloyl-ACP methyl ester carboxylesterase
MTDIDPTRFVVHHASPRQFSQAYVREGIGGVPLLCVHGWPETKRIFWKVIAPLAAAGFDVIVPDLRGFGDSDAPDGFGDVPTHSRDLLGLMDHLGLERAVVLGGDLGGPIISDLAGRFPDRVERMVLFNAPLPYLREPMASMGTRPPIEAADYFIRQGTDADGLAAELTSDEQRRRYIATFYSSRFWAHPGAFAGAVDFHTEPFGSATHLRAGFRAYEAAFSEQARSEAAIIGRDPNTKTLILFGPSDHVIYPDFDRMAAVVFPDHVGPFLLRDCGHFVPWEAPGPLASATVAFCGDLLRR